MKLSNQAVILLDRMVGTQSWPRLLACIALLICFVTPLAGCSGARDSATATVHFDPWTDQTPEYRIGAGDQIAVKLPYNAELNTDVLIGPDGRFTMPLVGSVLAAGLTSTELSNLLVKDLSGQIMVPAITVSVEKYASQRVYVGGQVKAPGSISLDGNPGLFEVITLAGGTLDTAGSKKIVLIRRSPSGRAMMRVVNLDRFLKTGDARDDVALRPLDIVYVPRSSIAEVDLWISQFIDQALPFNRGFDYTINSGNAAVGGGG